jgi:hypothetical protein
MAADRSAGSERLVKKRKNHMDSVGTGIAIGVAIGVGIGAAIDNMGAGIAIGIAIGAGIGASRKKNDNGDSDSE